MSTSTSPPSLCAASFNLDSICAVCLASLSSSRLLASKRIYALSATIFVASPPLISPTFAVVTSSTRPSVILLIASAAMLIAETPTSGSIPACAFLP